MASTTTATAAPPGAYERCHPQPNDRFVSVGKCDSCKTEITICYQTRGDAKNPCLLLVPGLSATLYMYSEALLEKFVEKGFYVVAYENRDSGCSTHLKDFAPPFPGRFALPKWASIGEGEPVYTLDDMARDGLRLLDKLNIPKAHVLGASMGGMVIQCMALLAPERVLSLNILFSHHGGADVKGPTWGMMLAFMDKPASEKDADLVEHKLRIMARLTTPTYPMDVEVARKECTMLQGRSPDDKEAVMRQQWAVLRSPSRVEGLRKLNTATQRHIPVTIIHGMDDEIIPVENGMQLAKTIAQSKLVLLAHVAHSIPPVLYDDLADEVGLHLLHHN